MAFTTLALPTVVPTATEPAPTTTAAPTVARFSTAAPTYTAAPTTLPGLFDACLFDKQQSTGSSGALKVSVECSTPEVVHLSCGKVGEPKDFTSESFTVDSLKAGGTYKAATKLTSLECGEVIYECTIVDDSTLDQSTNFQITTDACVRRAFLRRTTNKAAFFNRWWW